MRALIRLLDSGLRRANGVFEFRDDPACLLRLQITRAPHAVLLGQKRIAAGETILELHLWNEHVPPIPSTGPDLAWAGGIQRRFIRSLRAAAAWMKADPRARDVQAVSAISGLLYPGSRPGGVHFMQRLGFVVMPYHGPLGGFSEFWENFYSWWLMWAFNAGSLRSRRFLRLRRTEAWMTAAEFVHRYGADRVEKE